MVKVRLKEMKMLPRVWVTMGSGVLYPWEARGGLDCGRGEFIIQVWTWVWGACGSCLEHIWVWNADKRCEEKGFQALEVETRGEGRWWWGNWRSIHWFSHFPVTQLVKKKEVYFVAKFKLLTTSASSLLKTVSPKSYCHPHSWPAVVIWFNTPGWIYFKASEMNSQPSEDYPVPLPF